MFNKWSKLKSYLTNSLGEVGGGVPGTFGGGTGNPYVDIFIAIGKAVYKFFTQPAVQLTLFVAQGVNAHIKTQELKKTGQEILLTKFGTGGAMPVIYGTRRVAGTVVYMNTAQYQKELFVVYAIAGHEIDSFNLETLQIDGRPVSDVQVYRDGFIASDGTTRITSSGGRGTKASGNFFGSTQTEIDNVLAGTNPPNRPRMVFNCHTGATTQAADPMLVGCVNSWTTDHKLSGIAYIACNFEYDIRGQFTGLPNLTVVVNGKKLYDPRADGSITGGTGSQRANDASTHTWSANPSLALLDYMTDDDYGKGLDPTETTGDIDLGSFQTAADACDVSADTITHSSVVVELANTSTDVLVIANANEADFNNFKIGSTFTVTDGVTTYINNKRLIDKDIRQITDATDTAVATLQLTFEDGAVDTAITSNTTCTFTETQVKFDCHGVIDTEESILENTKALVANMRGIFTYSNGQYAIKVEGAESSVVTLDEDDIFESGLNLSLENKEAKFNKVEAEFYNAQKRYETDTTYYTGESSDDFLTDDGAEILETRIQLPFCTNQRIAYNHAKALLKRSRSQKTVAFVATPKVLQARVGEVITITSSNMGLSNALFRITNMVINPDLNIEVTAIEYQSDIYGYVTPPDESIGIINDPVDGQRVEAPTNLQFSGKNTSTGEPAKLTWTDSTKYPSYEFRVVVKTGNTSTIPNKTRFDRRTKETFFYLDGINIDSGFTAFVSAINTLGVESEATERAFAVTTAPVTTPDIEQGSIGGFSFTASKMYHPVDGSDTGVFETSNVYIDDSGQFSLKDKLSFDGTTLDISGNLTVENTITADKIVVDGINLDNLISASTQSGSIYLTEFTGIKIATSGSTSGYPPLLKLQDDTATDRFTDITQSQTGINIRARAGTNKGTITFQGIDSGITPSTYAQFDSSGDMTFNNDVTVTGDLTVNGTTVTLNTATLDVEDKNITLNYSTGDSSASANGAGITIQDAVNSTTDATILWDATNDEFDFSHTVDIPTLKLNGTTVTATATELNYVDGVTSDIQTQLDAKYEANDNVTLGTITSDFFTTASGEATIYLGTTTPDFKVGRNANEHIKLAVTDSTGSLTYVQDETGSVNHSFRFDIASSSSGDNRFNFDKDLNVTGGSVFRMGGTQIIDASTRNMSNIGTISSGAITASGAITSTSGVSRFQGGLAVGGDNDIYFYESTVGNGTIRTGSSGAYKFFTFESGGNLNVTGGGLEIGSQEVITTSRNLINIGTIDTSGDVTANGLEVGTAYASDSQYLGIKRSAASSNDYMIIQGSSDTNTYITAGSGSSVRIRPNSNSTTNQLIVSSSGTTLGTLTASGNITTSGVVTINSAGAKNALVLSGSSPTMAFTDTTSGHDHFWLHVNSNNFYILADRDGSTGAYGQWETPYPLQLEADTNKGYLFGNEILYDGANISVGTITASQTLTLNASGTNNTSIEIGANTASNHYAFIDLVGDATYTDYGLRIIRNNGGANTSSFIYHRGTGNFNIETQDSAAIKLRTAGTDALTIDTSQRVGIGTSSPSEKLDVVGGGLGVGNGTIKTVISYNTRGVFGTTSNHDLEIRTNNTERMRLMTQGSLLIGKTVVDNTTDGIRLDGTNNFVSFVRDGGEPLLLNRKTSDGALITFRKDGSNVGVIGTQNWGIGTTSPSRQLTVYNDSAAVIGIKSNSTGLAQLALGDGTDDNYAQILLDNSANKLQIQNGGGGSIGNRGITLDSSERVGIGTSSPSYPLDVRKNQAGYTYIAADNANAAASGTGSGFAMTESGTVAWYLRNERDGTGKFNIGNSANRLTIDSTGRVGIGTISPSSTLHLANSSGVSLRLEDTGSHNFRMVCENGVNSLNFKEGSGNTILSLEGSGRRVGIGSSAVSAPAQLLHVAGTGSSVQFGSSGVTTPLIHYGMPTFYGVNSADDVQNFSFRYSNSNSYAFNMHQRVTSGVVRWSLGQRNANVDYNDVLVFHNGNVAIGQQNASRKLDVSGEIGGIGKVVLQIDSNDNARFTDDQDNYIEFDGANYEMDFALDSTVLMKLQDNGALHCDNNITAYSTTVGSDIKLKKNIRDLESSLDKTLKLRGVQFDWKDAKKGNDQLGFIAQEVEEILPELVAEAPTLGTDDTHKTVDYQGVIPVLVEAIKELKAEIEELKKK